MFANTKCPNEQIYGLSGNRGWVSDVPIILACAPARDKSFEKTHHA